MARATMMGARLLSVALYIVFASGTELMVEYSGGRMPARGLEAVHAALHEVGVGFESMPLPAKARGLLAASMHRGLTETETAQVLEIFKLSREEIVNMTLAAGREPVIPGGGDLSPHEVGQAPTPRLWDMGSLSDAVRMKAMKEHTELVVKHALDGPCGIDEVHLVVSGGPWHWFFRHPTGGVLKLSIPAVDPTLGSGWQASYPGLGPHGAYLDTPHGLVVDYVTGPAVWTRELADDPVNPWIDMSSDVPRLLDTPRLV